MTTFDGSTGRLTDQDTPPVPVPTVVPEVAAPWDAIESLREQLESRDKETDDVATVEIPGLGWRLVCEIDMPYKRYAAWQKMALPPNQRNRRRGPNPIDLDQAELAKLVLLGTCVGMEFQRPGTEEWAPLLDPRGAPVTPDGEWFMSRFNEVDPAHCLRKLFGSEAKLMRGGEIVIKAAGWGAEDDEADPTD